MVDNIIPRASLLLICYNQEQYIRDAVCAAFAQTYSNLQIVISDDCSTDATYSLVSDLVESYRGLHTIVLCKTEINSGINGNINHAMTHCDGELIVAAAGDDISGADRVERLVDFWLKQNCTSDYLYSDYFIIKTDGKPLGYRKARIQLFPTMIETARLGCVATGASQAWSSRLWHKFGPLPTGFAGEDAVMAFRAKLTGGIGYINAPLLKWRSDSSTWVSSDRANPDTLRQRFLMLARHMVADALANRDDIVKLGRNDLIPYVDLRVAEMNFVFRIAAGENIVFSDCIRALNSGMRKKTVLLYYFVYRYTFFAIYLIKIRRWLFSARGAVNCFLVFILRAFRK